VADQRAGCDRCGRVRDLSVRDAQKYGVRAFSVGAATQRADELNSGALAQGAPKCATKPAVADDGKTKVTAGVV
jgi:hypothetical protein